MGKCRGSQGRKHRQAEEGRVGRYRNGRQAGSHMFSHTQAGQAQVEVPLPLLHPSLLLLYNIIQAACK